MTEDQYLTAIYSFNYFGPARVNLLLSYFKKAKNIWLATNADLNEINIPEKKIMEFEEYRRKFDIEDYFERLDKLQIKVLTILDKDYPSNLKEISDAPSVLYIRGNLKKSDTNSVAIVGSRMMTSYGREVAGKFAAELANFGITIISGLALGVDAEAQRAALSVGGRTVAVLASGLDIISPLTNKSLALEFMKGNGAIVSEYPLGHEPMPYDFPVRDRLISGLAKAVVVIEGRMRSGTFYTVKAAADQGRPVFAVPGPITSPASEAPNYLIQNGAKLITTAKDVMDELDFQVKVDKEKIERIIPRSVEEESLVELLRSEPLHLDELTRMSGCPTNEISARLTIMEMKGLVKNLGKGIYRKI